MCQPPVFSIKAINNMIGTEKHLICRINSEVIAESRTLSVQYTTFVTIISRRLRVSLSEVDQVNS